MRKAITTTFYYQDSIRRIAWATDCSVFNIKPAQVCCHRQSNGASTGNGHIAKHRQTTLQLVLVEEPKPIV